MVRCMHVIQVSAWLICHKKTNGAAVHAVPSALAATAGLGQRASTHLTTAKHSDNLGGGASLLRAMSVQALLNLCNPGLQVRERAGAVTPRGRARRDRAPQPAHCVERAAAAVP